MTNKEFIAMIGPKATKDYQKHGVLASITIAQACLESNYGNSELAMKANNLFGMKTFLSGNNWNSVWDGVSKYTKATNEEYVKGTYTVINTSFRKYSSIDLNIEDHSLYLTQAKNGSKLRYAGLNTEKNYKKAAQIIKDGGYATDSSYVSKLCKLIEQYNLTQYDILSKNKEEEKKEEKGKMKIIESILTKNPCYTAGRKITVKGLMLHSVGTPQPKAEVFVNSWNSPSYSSACVHAFIDGNTGVVYQTLPWNHRGWHGGGSSNNTHIGVEMCEPATIRYTGGSTFTCSNLENAKASVKRTYESAVQLFAYLCKEFKLDPLADGVIVSHKEGHSRGIATNHGDPEHLWNGLNMGYTMNGFRKDVKAAMSGSTTITTTPSENNTVSNSVIKKYNPYAYGVVTATELNVRSGPSTNNNIIRGLAKGNEIDVIEKYSNGWLKINIVGTIGYVSGNYINITERKASKPSTATEDKKPSSSFKAYTVKVTASALNIREGAGTQYRSVGVIRDRGIYTIVEEKNNWGKLKSGLGWICLDYTKKQ